MGINFYDIEGNNMSEKLFYIGALPAIIGFIFWFFVSLLLSSAIDRNPDIKKKWSGWGGGEFSKDVDKIDDIYIKRLLKLSESVCPRILIVGIVLSCILEVIFFIMF